MKTNKKFVSSIEEREIHLLIHRISSTWLSKWAEKGQQFLLVLKDHLQTDIIINVGANVYHYNEAHLERLSGYKRCLNPWKHSPNRVQYSDPPLDLANHATDLLILLCFLDHVPGEKHSNVLTVPKQTAVRYRMAQVMLFISNNHHYSAIQISHHLLNTLSVNTTQNNKYHFS